MSLNVLSPITPRARVSLSSSRPSVRTRLARRESGSVRAGTPLGRLVVGDLIIREDLLGRRRAMSARLGALTRSPRCSTGGDFARCSTQRATLRASASTGAVGVRGAPGADLCRWPRVVAGGAPARGADSRTGRSSTLTFTSAVYHRLASRAALRLPLDQPVRPDDPRVAMSVALHAIKPARAACDHTRRFAIGVYDRGTCGACAMAQQRGRPKRIMRIARELAPTGATKK
jgi:hypothetical protein